LLNKICKKENKFSQYEFAKWCDNLTMAFDDDEADDLIDRDKLASRVAQDIECQWEL
jgi:CRISPR/Cas system CMR-associated protein Cmr3 (group 5 of RAMP superfamily)